MGASRSRKKYQVPQTDDDAPRDLDSLGSGQGDTVSSQFVSATDRRTSRRPNFPAVLKTRTASHPGVRPEWAVPKFSRWAKHAQEQIDNQGAYRAQKSLSGALKFERKYATRYRFDRLLSPRTIFKEIYDKPLDLVTEKECFIVDTFVEERQRIWRVEDEAAHRLQCYWRVCQARMNLQAKRDDKKLKYELDMADRRLRHDMEISRVLEVQGQKVLEAEAARSKLLKYEEEQAAKRKRHEESWIVGFIAAGGVKKLGSGAHHSSREVSMGKFSYDFVSDRRYKIISSVLGRLAEAGEIRWAWQGVRIRDAFRTWHDETARARFHTIAMLWHLQGWFDKWHYNIRRIIRLRYVLQRVLEKLLIEKSSMAFHKWWRNTRRRFRIVQVPGNRFPITRGARVLSEGGRLTPRSAVITNPLDVSTMQWRLSTNNEKGARMTQAVKSIVEKRVKPGNYSTAASAGHTYIHRYANGGGGYMI